MRRLFFLVALIWLLTPARAQMLQPIVADTPATSVPTCATLPAFLISVQIPGSATTTTSAPIDTTGATGIVGYAGYSWGAAGDSVTFSDSKSNTWINKPATTHDPGNQVASKMWTCQAPCIVGSGHTFTLHDGGSGIFGQGVVAAMTGTTSADIPGFWAYNGSGGTSATLQPGAVSPTQNCQIIFQGIQVAGATHSPATPAGYTVAVANDDPTFSQNTTLAYKIQTTAAVENPTWGNLDNLNAASAITIGSANATVSPSWTAAVCAVYTGPGRCNEAWSLTRDMTGTYSGTLFTLRNTLANTNMNVPVTGHVVDMTGVNAFCGSSTVTNGQKIYNNCVIAVIDAQLNHANDLTAATVSRINLTCSAINIYQCAAPLAIDLTTGLPCMYEPSSGYQYNVGGNDAATTGIVGGASPRTLVYVGKPLPLQVTAGQGTVWGARDTIGISGTNENFLMVLAYGQGGGGLVNCNTSVGYCDGFDTDCTLPGCSTQSNFTWDYSENVISDMLFAMNKWDSSHGMTGYVNSTTPLGSCPVATCGTMNTSNRWVLAGGGDASQPAPMNFSEGYIVSEFSSAGEDAAALANVRAFYRMAVFP